MSDADQHGSAGFGGPTGGTWGAPAPAGWGAPDPWGHEHGEDAAHRLDASGHMHHQTDPRARLIGEPHVVTSRDRAMRALLGGAAVVGLLGALVGAILAFS